MVSSIPFSYKNHMVSSDYSNLMIDIFITVILFNVITDNNNPYLTIISLINYTGQQFILLAQSAGAVEYTDCFSGEG